MNPISENVYNFPGFNTSMGNRHQLTDNEKELLTVLGRHPEISMKELYSRTSYRRMSTVTRKVNQLKDQHMLTGPVYQVDYGKVCKNTLYRLFCFIEFSQSYEKIIEYLKLIEPLVMIYPVLSPHKKIVGAGFISSNNAEVRALLQMLKDNTIVTDFVARARKYRVSLENPDFFGDSVPALDNLLDPCDIPDIPYGHHDTEWNECDIATLSHLHGGYESIKLIDILRKEKKSNRNWTYDQIKYSHEKLVRNKVAGKQYYIYPFPIEECADFFLFIKTDTEELTHRILCNFARGGRIHREYTICDDWGMMGCISHPLLVVDLMQNLDEIGEIKEKEMYQIRSISLGVQYAGKHTEFKYFDVETQTLEYPYHLFREKIKEKIEKEK